MIGTGTSRALLATAGCLLLASCGAAQSSSAPAGANSAATSAAAASAATSAAATAAATSTATPAATAATVKAGGSGITACELVTKQDASTALGMAAGQGSAGGTAALSECIYADGALLVSMRPDSKALYDKSLASAQAKGVPSVSGIGDSAFKTGTDKTCVLLFVKGTVLVSIIFTGTGAQAAAVAVARVAAAKL